MNELRLWQEYDCPLGSDSDRSGEELLIAGQSFYCHWCGGQHVTTALLVQTYALCYLQGDDLPTLISVQLPRSAAELAELRKEYE